LQFGNIRAKLVFSAIVSIALLGIGFNDAFADVPNIDTFVADDPDDGDLVYSVGDTFTLAFDLPINVTASATMSQGAIDGNFTLSGGAVFGVTYTGLWSGDRLSLTITVNTVGAPNPTIGGTTVSAAGTSNLGHAGDPPTAATLTGLPTLGGNYGAIAGGQGSSPKGGYQPPTMGITRHGLVLVEEGFSYNGNPVDVHLVNTHYPLVTTNVGEENVAKLVIYSPRGIERLQHAAIGFGLDKNEVFGHSNVVIEWDRLHNGDETITVIDPENYLADVKVVTSEGQCRASSNELCFIIDFYHTFRQSLDYNIIGTYIWDDKRSGWQNFYNDGVEILGDSLNPPAKHQASHKGKIIEITEYGKNVAYDQEGNLWTFDKSWKMEYQPKVKIDDGITSKGIERNNVKFNAYLDGQNLLAEYLLKSSVQGSKIKNNDVGESIAFEYNFISRNNDIELQNRISNQLERAEELFADRFIVNEDDEFQKYWKIHQQYLEQISRD